ncbi:DNA adenine methylase [Helicobacter sp. 13S00477-4]|uniref:DNA adenine methylase n=1 Tax=Helicobacter sp. 13S00477-4 TaxID=1905759 RepID=UPI000BA7C484|nr:DNA adenine methylase [Helicobacter sp. 13S00477-4]PAF51999.1 hypothetical protein BKH44_04890 [Helicobacter sp. 13S00477-4]
MSLFEENILSPSLFYPTNLTSPFGWIGGKRKLANLIVSMMPKHSCYVEVFGGGLSVLYAKPKITREKYNEVINDINSELINLHKIIQTRPASLSDYLNDMLRSREIFYDIKKGILKPRNDIQKAAFYFYRIAFSFGSNTREFGMYKGKKPKNIYKSFKVYAQRLKGVCIENMDFKKLIQQYDSKDSFFYLDPPYVGTEHQYKHTGGFKLDAHKDLCTMLSNIKGKFLLSYNDCEFVREQYKDFKIQKVQVRYTISQEHSRMNNELLIYNY